MTFTEFIAELKPDKYYHEWRASSKSLLWVIEKRKYTLYLGLFPEKNNGTLFVSKGRGCYLCSTITTTSLEDVLAWAIMEMK